MLRAQALALVLLAGCAGTAADTVQTARPSSTTTTTAAEPPTTPLTAVTTTSAPTPPTTAARRSGTLRTAAAAPAVVVTAPAPPSSEAPKQEPAAGEPPDSDFDRLAGCESGGRWDLNTGNGYYGGLQFSASTWHAYGGTELPHQHTRDEQITVARRLWRARGWQPWPSCSRQLGLR